MCNKIRVVRSPFSGRWRCTVVGICCKVEAEVTKNVAASNLHSQLFKDQLVVCFLLLLFPCYDMMNTTVGSDEAPFLIKAGFWSLIFSPPDQTLSEVPSN